MQKILCLLLGLCLLTGCQSRELVDETVAETKPSADVSLPEEADGSKLPGESLAFSNPGKARVPYTGIRSYAEYVTSPDQLPQEEVFKSYDQAYFENHALVLVMETVSSGSVQLELDGLYLQEGTVTVTLKRAMPGHGPLAAVGGGGEGAGLQLDPGNRQHNPQGGEILKKRRPAPGGVLLRCGGNPACLCSDNRIPDSSGNEN